MVFNAALGKFARVENFWIEFIFTITVTDKNPLTWLLLFRFVQGFMTVEFVYLLALLVYRSPSLYKECILELGKYLHIYRMSMIFV